MELRVRALETVLAQKGYIDPAALDVLIDTYQTKIGPRNGARVVAHAWADPAFRDWLLRDATAAIASLGYSGRQGEHMVVLENTPDAPPHGRVHAVQLLPLAGAGPAAHLVQERALPLAGGEGPARRAGRLRRRLPEGTEIRVWDSTAEVRYLVLPKRPPGTEGLSEENSPRW